MRRGVGPGARGLSRRGRLRGDVPGPGPRRRVAAAVGEGWGCVCVSRGARVRARHCSGRAHSESGTRHGRSRSGGPPPVTRPKSPAHGRFVCRPRARSSPWWRPASCCPAAARVVAVGDVERLGGEGQGLDRGGRDRLPATSACHPATVGSPTRGGRVPRRGVGDRALRVPVRGPWRSSWGRQPVKRPAEGVSPRLDGATVSGPLIPVPRSPAPPGGTPSASAPSGPGSRRRRHVVRARRRIPEGVPACVRPHARGPPALTPSRACRRVMGPTVFRHADAVGRSPP
ncbi:hypothetical protein GA0115245_128213 [Streptomyces sp. di188]|nr:hypothetical protein GA0115238_139613 [Streptomyces sp. di50b]SCE25555.1 hypothetical protein GA0115245_128213 [Streptomyces sp. di188]